jgi:hypothetical protein
VFSINQVINFYKVNFHGVDGRVSTFAPPAPLCKKSFQVSIARRGCQVVVTAIKRAVGPSHQQIFIRVAKPLFSTPYICKIDRDFRTL